MEKDEEVIASWHGYYSSLKGKPVKDDMKVITVLPRVFLVLTNRRVIFIKELGILSKSHRHLFSIPLEEVEAISTRENEFPFVEIVEKNTTHRFYYDSKDNV